MTRIAIILTISALTASFAHAHGGGTDANGCHTQKATGDRHCHRGGKTSSSSKSSSSSVNEDYCNRQYCARSAAG